VLWLSELKTQGNTPPELWALWLAASAVNAYRCWPVLAPLPPSAGGHSRGVSADGLVG